MTSFPVKMRLSDKTLRYLGLKCPKIFLRISTIETCSKISARRPFFEFRNKRTLAVYFISVSHMTVKNFQKLKILISRSFIAREKDFIVEINQRIFLYIISHWYSFGPCLSFNDSDLCLLWPNANDH